MDPSIEVQPLEGDNNREEDRYATLQDINNILSTFRIEMMNDFTAQMRSLLQVSNEKIKKEVKSLRDKVSDLKDLKG